MDLYKNETNFSSFRSTFYCPYAPHVSWKVGGSTFDLIIGLIKFMVAFPTILLNALIILAIKQRRELQKPSNIMLSSMAVSDLLAGFILIPSYATIDFLSLSQVSFEYSCVLYAVTHFFRPLIFTATMHHLTVIAWERYVAVKKWMDYKRIITNGRLKKFAITAWLSAFLPTIATFTTTVVFADRTIMERILKVWGAVEVACLFIVAFFYLNVYLEIRNRKLNGISQINVLMKAKRQESKVAKTTGLLTAAVVSSFIPVFIVRILGHVVPVLRTNELIRLNQIVAQLNSLFNPLLYCYRDHRFKNAIRDLLGMKKPRTQQSSSGDKQFVTQKGTLKSSKLHKMGKRTQRLTRSASCNLTDASYPIPGTPCVIMLKRSLSAPTLDTCNSSLDSLDPQQHSSIVKKLCNDHY